MVATRLGIICLVSALFAGGFAGLVRYSNEHEDGIAYCRNAANPGCFGPVQR